MKNLIIAILSVSLLSFTGCCNSKKKAAKPQTELTNASAYNTGMTAYLEVKKRVAKGYLSKEAGKKADAAWDKFDNYVIASVKDLDGKARANSKASQDFQKRLTALLDVLHGL